MATAMGHLDLARQGIRSTRRSPKRVEVTTSSTAPPTESSDHETDDEEQDTTTRRATTLYTDSTGNLPKVSMSGYKFALIATYKGYIHSQPVKSHDSDDLIDAMEQVYLFYQARGQTITKHIMDNEASNDMKMSYIAGMEPTVELQLVLPR